MSTPLFSSPYPEDYLQPELIPYWLEMRDIQVHMLFHAGKGKQSYYGATGGNRFLYPHERYIKESILNGRKPKNSSIRNGSSNFQPNSIEWVNAPLTDQDYDTLERDETSFDALACMLLGLVGDGYGVSVKFNFERGSFNCTVFRSPCDGNRRNLGLSGSAADVRDAILVTLYRFEHSCGGVLDDNTPTSASSKPKRRFG